MQWKWAVKSFMNNREQELSHRPIDSHSARFVSFFFVSIFLLFIFFLVRCARSLDRCYFIVYFEIANWCRHRMSKEMVETELRSWHRSRVHFFLSIFSSSFSWFFFSFVMIYSHSYLCTDIVSVCHWLAVFSVLAIVASSFSNVLFRYKCQSGQSEWNFPSVEIVQKD